VTCPTFELLSAEADGALNNLEAEALKAHLDGCPQCHTRRAELLLLKRAVRNAAAPAEASDALKQRLAAAARSRPRSGQQFRSAIVLGFASAAMALGFLVPVLRDRAALAETIGDHVDITVKREEPFDAVSDDPKVLERAFAGKIDFGFRIPVLPAARLVGARLCHIGGREVPLASYERDGRRISLFASRGGGNNRQADCQEGVSGFTVCRRRTDGVDYTLVSDYPQAEAKSILMAAAL
jgi:anti-sigma factor RsiW